MAQTYRDATITLGQTRWTYCYMLGDDSGRMLFVPEGEGAARVAAITRPRVNPEPLLMSSPVVLTRADIHSIVITHEDESETIIGL